MGTEPRLELLSPEAERGKEQRNVEMRTKGRKEKGKKNQQMKQNKQPQVEGEIVVWSLNRKRFLKQGITDNLNYHRKP